VIGKALMAKNWYILRVGTNREVKELRRELDHEAAAHGAGGQAVGHGHGPGAR
jgi:hypothetical protein